MIKFVNRFGVWVTTLVILCSASAAHAQVTYSWNGNSSTSVNLAGNWSPSGGPTSSTLDTANFGTAGSQGATLSQTALFSTLNLTFNGPSSFTWNSGANGITLGSTTAATPRGTLANNSNAKQI